MACAVNLLNWRKARRRQCLSFWILLSVGGGLLMLLLAVTARQANHQRQRWHDIKVVNSQALMQKLVQREPQLRVRQQQKLAAQKQQQQQAATRGWQNALSTLAAHMPEKAWLTEVQWQGDSLSLSGLVTHFSALMAVESTVRQLPGFLSLTPGATKRDDQGRWQFSYQLKAGEAYVISR